MIELGLFILSCVKKSSVCAEVVGIRTMYWTPAKSRLKIFGRRYGKAFCAFGLEMCCASVRIGGARKERSQ